MDDLYVTRATPLPNTRRLCTAGFSLVVPEEVQSAREKILYALWHVGELAFHKILLFTDLERSEAEYELAKLVDAGLVKSSHVQVGTQKSDNNFISSTFRIVNSKTMLFETTAE